MPKLKILLTTKGLLIAILILASFLRLYRIGEYMEFLGDQGRDMVIIRDLLKNGNFFFIGPQTSIGNMYLGPYFYYLIAPFLWLFAYNPIGPSIFVALLNVLTVYLVYRVARVWFNRKAGLLSALLFAVSPVVVTYSGFSWNPNVLPLFSLLFIYLLERTVSQSKPILLLPSTLSFIMALNSHYLALLLLFPAAYILIPHLFKVKDKKPLLGYILLSFLLFLASLLPLILFDLKHNWQNTQAFITFFLQRQTTVSIKPYKAIPQIFPLFQQLVTRFPGAKLDLIGQILSLLLPLGIIFSFTRLKNKSRLYLLLVWLLSALIGLGLYKQHIYDHYFGFVSPGLFIIFGVILAILLEKFKVLALLLAFTLTALSLSQSHLRRPPNRQMQTVQEIDASILAASNGEPFNLALLAKQNYDPPYRYFLYQAKAPLYDLHDRITSQLFVICEPFQMKCQPINNPKWEIAAFGWAKIADSWEINGITIFKLVPNPDGQKNPQNF